MEIQGEKFKLKEFFFRKAAVIPTEAEGNYDNSAKAIPTATAEMAFGAKTILTGNLFFFFLISLFNLSCMI